MVAYPLCASQKNWLASQPQLVKAYYQQCLEQGLYYRKQQAWRQAVPFIGHALHMAELLVNEHSDQQNSIVKYTSAAILLADTYQQAKMHRTRKSALSDARACLDTVEVNSEFESIWLNCLSLINEQLNQTHPNVTIHRSFTLH